MKKKSKFANEPAWVFSISTALISFLLIFIVAHLLIDAVGFSGEIGSYLAYSFYGVFVIGAIFLICINYPKNILYTILICNAAGIFPVTGEQSFWTSYLWIIFVVIWILSIISGLIGSAIGKKKNIEHKNQL